MFDDQLTAIISFLTGCGSGVYIGIASGTAEPFIIPLMMLVISSSIYEAIGTSLFVDCVIGLSAGIIFFLKGNVKLKPVLLLAIPAVTLSFIGSFFSTGAREIDLKILIALVLIMFGLILIRGGIKRNVEYIERKVNLKKLRENRQILFLACGSLIGFASGFTGMGSSGSMTILLLFIMGYDLHTSIGTSLMIMSFVGFSGAVAHGAILGDIVLHIALFAGAGASIGALIGSLFANKINEDLLGRVIGLIITILGFVVLIEIFINGV